MLEVTPKKKKGKREKSSTKLYDLFSLQFSAITVVLSYIEFISNSKTKQICLNCFENIIESLAESSPMHKEFYTIPGFFSIISAFACMVWLCFV